MRATVQVYRPRITILEGGVAPVEEEPPDEEEPPVEVILDAGGADTITWIGATAIVYSNMPTTPEEIFAAANRRIPCNLVGRTTVTPFVGGTASAGAGSGLIARYSIDAAASWHDFSPACEVSAANLSSATSTTVGTTVAIPAEAQIDTALVTWFGRGDATPTEDPAFATLGVVLA